MIGEQDEVTEATEATTEVVTAEGGVEEETTATQTTEDPAQASTWTPTEHLPFAYEANKNVFADNLPSSMNEEKFNDLFSAFVTEGAIESIKFLKHMTGSETGYGFVQFSSDKDGKRAIENLNGKFIDGHNIRVIQAKPPKHDL